MSPQVCKDSQSEKDDFVKIPSADAVVDKSPMAHLQSVVASEHHTKKFQAKRRPVEQAQPVKGGEEQESGGEGGGRGSQRPHGVTGKVMTQIIILRIAAKNAGKQNSFMHPATCVP